MRILVSFYLVCTKIFFKKSFSNRSNEHLLFYIVVNFDLTFLKCQRYLIKYSKIILLGNLTKFLIVRDNKEIKRFYKEGFNIKI